MVITLTFFICDGHTIIGRFRKFTTQVSQLRSMQQSSGKKNSIKKSGRSKTKKQAEGYELRRIRLPFQLSPIVPLTNAVDRPNSDGDNCPVRRQIQMDVLHIVSASKTRLPDVGLELWNGALILCDYLFDLIDSDKKSTVFLELGSGTGLAAIAMAKLGYPVIATDYHYNVLKLVQMNAAFNDVDEKLLTIKRLDWRDKGNFHVGNGNEFHWSRRDFIRLVKCDTLLLADCIYDLDLNSQLFTTLECLIKNLPNLQRLIFSIDERINFDAETRLICSPAYDHFLEWMEKNLGPEWQFRLIDSSLIGRHFLPEVYERTEFMKIWLLEKRRND